MLRELKPQIGLSAKIIAEEPMNSRHVAIIVAAAVVLAIAIGLLARRGCAPAQPQPPRDTPAAEEDAPGSALDVLDLEPADGAVIRGSQAWVRWGSADPSRGLLHWRRKGEAEFRDAEVVAGRFHLAHIAALEKGAAYEFWVENVGADHRTRSPVRTFECAGGLDFDPPALEITVKRDYDQRVTIALRNSGKDAVRVAARALAEFEDLPAGFVGHGSADAPAELAPGASIALTYAVTASDAARDRYEIPIEAAGAFTQIVVKVALPRFDLAMRQVSQDPRSLARTVDIMNKGELLTDLSVKVAKPNHREARLAPAVNHATLGPGHALRVVVSPVLYLEFESLDLELECAAAGRSVRFPLRFDAPRGKSLVGVRTHTDETTSARDKVCTNKPTTCSEVPGGSGTGPETPPPDPSADARKRAVDEFRKYVGKDNVRYGPTGTVDTAGNIRFDCSGLTTTALSSAGFPDFNYGSGTGGCDNMWNNLKDNEVKQSEAEAGDVIFFDYWGHKTKGGAWEERVADKHPDHCGLVASVGTDGSITYVDITDDSSGYDGKETNASQRASGYYKTPTKVNQTQMKMKDMIFGIARPKLAPPPGECKEGKPCHEGGK